MYLHGSEERLIQVARGDKIDDLETSVLNRSERRRLEKIRRLGGEKVLHG